MKVIVPDMAHESIDSLFEYLAIYSSKCNSNNSKNL